MIPNIFRITTKCIALETDAGMPAVTLDDKYMTFTERVLEKKTSKRNFIKH